jgi:hypothetical protein
MDSRRRALGDGPDHFLAAGASAASSAASSAAAAAALDDGALVAARPLEENCGVYGVVGASNASRAVFFAL